ncbi:hypothetical protein LIER_12956 [Lithospermum erythrorhizon]|uniref:Retrovirus-related Pol polyprotein from transposon TNT 1-94 n=1 Tax=Lithospermum erythrorhizon TaxID=34254 RepID=A0AAV3PVM1_LITER
MYVMVCTRPNVAHVVRVVSKYMSNSGRENWDAVKWIFKYLKGTSDKDLCFQRFELGLLGYVYDDNGDDIDSRKSIIGRKLKLCSTSVNLQI